MPRPVAAATRWSKSVERAELGVDGLVARLRGSPMAQGLPGSSGPGVSVLFGPLRKAAADRVDRREVEHVEAHRGDVGEPRLGRP